MVDDSTVVQRFICASVHLGLLARSADGKRLTYAALVGLAHTHLARML